VPDPAATTPAGGIRFCCGARARAGQAHPV